MVEVCRSRRCRCCVTFGCLVVLVDALVQYILQYRHLLQLLVGVVAAAGFRT